MRIQESAQNYLETILMLSMKNPEVHAIDIVRELNFTKPSVSVAMKNLRREGYIEIDADYNITLTEKGLKIAEDMYARHVTLTECLALLGVDRDIAARDACRIEHILSQESFTAIKKYLARQRPDPAVVENARDGS